MPSTQSDPLISPDIARALRLQAYWRRIKYIYAFHIVTSVVFIVAFIHCQQYIESYRNLEEDWQSANYHYGGVKSRRDEEMWELQPGTVVRSVSYMRGSVIRDIGRRT